jgi:hypothetical protein
MLVELKKELKEKRKLPRAQGASRIPVVVVVEVECYGDGDGRYRHAIRMVYWKYLVD